MTPILNPDFIRNLQSNKNINFKSKIPYGNLLDRNNNNNWDQHCFQLLIIEKNNNDKWQKPKLVYGTKKQLLGKYQLDSSHLPAYGAEVKEDFFADPTGQRLNRTQQNLQDSTACTVRFLLQCRILSQNMAATWLEENQVEEETFTQIELSKQILDTYNIKPESYIFDPPNSQSIKRLKNVDLEKYLQKIEGLLVENDNIIDFLKSKGSFLIKPTYVSYSSISLALLLCGQAYYECGKDGNGNKQWKRIWEPIFSTYEMVWEYALDLSWDTFYATRIDIPQTGKDPKPPYTKVTLGYPPRPDKHSLKQKQIREWFQAPEDFENSKYPFYPQQATDEWENKELEFVVPPSPYIPLSTI